MTDVAIPETRLNLAQMTRFLTAQAELNETIDNGNPEFVMDIMESILSAESIDEVFAAQDAGGMIAGKDFTNRPFTIASINDIEWRTSKHVETGGYPVFAIIKATEIATGETVVLNCGGKTFVAVLFKLIELGYFDASDGGSLMLVSTTTGGGNAYLSLTPYKTAQPARGKR